MKPTKFLIVAHICVFAVLLLASMAAQAQNQFTIPAAPGPGFSTSIRPAPTYVQARVLAAGVAETVTLPANTRIVIFSANCNFHAKPGASAAVPAADVTDGTASEMNPSAWYFANAAGATQDVTVISSGACIVTLSAYQGKLQ